MEEKKTQTVCPYAKKCGGCQYQGVPYSAQLKETKAGTGAFEEVWKCEAGNWNERSLFLPE